jgi:hypothetical protein
MLHIVGSREQSSNVEKDSVLAGFRMNSCRTYVRRYYRIYKETVDRLRISISSYRMRNSICETHFDVTNITNFLFRNFLPETVPSRLRGKDLI